MGSRNKRGMTAPKFGFKVIDKTNVDFCAKVGLLFFNNVFNKIIDG